MSAKNYRANRVRLCPDAEAEAELRLLARRCSALWNVANYLCRQRFLGNEGVPGFAAMDRQLKHHPVYRSLPSDVAQEMLKKLAESWTSYWALRKLWHKGELLEKPGLPKYRKDRKSGHLREDFVPIQHSRSYSVGAQEAFFVLSSDRRKARGGGRLAVVYRGLRRYSGPAGRGEIRYDRGRGRWYFQWAVQFEAKEDRAWVRAAAVDLGVRVLASVTVEGEAVARHYSGRDVLKDWDYFGRRIAEHQREIAHRGKKSSKRLSGLYAKRKARLIHAWEAIAADMVRHLKRHRVGVVFLGHPKEILRDTQYSRLWNGRIHSFWSFDQALKILEKHLHRARIRSERVGERGTSSTCTVDPMPEGEKTHKVVRSPRHWLACRTCGLGLHSDQAGSRNILRFQIPSIRWDAVEATARTETHWWTKHRWVDSENQRGKIALPKAA